MRERRKQSPGVHGSTGQPSSFSSHGVDRANPSFTPSQYASTSRRASGVRSPACRSSPAAQFIFRKNVSIATDPSDGSRYSATRPWPSTRMKII